MDVRKIIATGALLLIAPFVTQEALALTPGSPVNVEVFISGSSAQQISLGQVVSSMCQTGTLDTYYNGDGISTTPPSGSSWRSYFCTLDSTKSGGVSGNMLLNNRAKGGSVWGVIPVNRSWNVEYMNINNSHCVLTTSPHLYNCAANTSAGPVDPSTSECFQTGAVNARTGSDKFCHTSDGGVSDVEPAMFIPPNLPSGWSALNSTELSKFTHGTNQFSEIGVIFGILASEDVYRDLQRTQGLVSYPTPDDPVANPTDWTEAKRPSMKRSEVVTLLNGNLTNWQDFNAAMVNAGTTPSISGANGLMAICRRVPGSGTQAGANAYWMENPCRAGSLVAGNTNMVTATNSQPGYQVVENSATGDVLTCLNDAYSGIDFGTATFFGAKHGGIGIVGIDITGGATPHPVHPTDHYDFVKIDGVSPSVANAASGAYNYWFEQAIQWLKTTDGGPSGSVLTLLGKVRDISGNPSTITSVPISGVAALGENGWVWSNPANAPTMRGARNGNSCREVLLSK